MAKTKEQAVEIAWKRNYPIVPAARPGEVGSDYTKPHIALEDLKAGDICVVGVIRLKGQPDSGGTTGIMRWVTVQAALPSGIAPFDVPKDEWVCLLTHLEKPHEYTRTPR
jgi:hypothetical protein